MHSIHNEAKNRIPPCKLSGNGLVVVVWTLCKNADGLAQNEDEASQRCEETVSG